MDSPEASLHVLFAVLVKSALIKELEHLKHPFYWLRENKTFN